MIRFHFLFFLVIFALQTSRAQTQPEEDCTQPNQVVRLLNAKNAAKLAEVMEEVGTKDGFQLLRAYRVFELSPQSRAAAQNLLSTIPSSDQANGTWLELIRSTDESYCMKSDKQYDTVDGTQDGYPQSLSRAVLLAPQFLTPYIRYSIIAVAANETNSDYADRMQKVCRVEHARFLASFGKLSVADQKEIGSRIFDPTHCHALYVHEQ